MRPRLLDLFCGAGGASAGYARAGFEVVGVDVAPQRNYPFPFIQAEALEFLEGMSWGELCSFQAIHASPPCQFATDYIRAGNVRESPNLIPATRAALEAAGLPYIIENVKRARGELRRWAMLCGSMFDPPLEVKRHRYFETSWGFVHGRRCRHSVWPPDRYPGGRSVARTGRSTGLVRATVEIGSGDVPLEVQRAAMGISWMSRGELSQAIPPAFTELIGLALRERLAERARHEPALALVPQRGGDRAA